MRSRKLASTLLNRSFQSSAIRLNNIKVEVNGNEVEIPNGATVYNACEEAGVYIPHFCYHDRLSIAGNCRMCLVEVEKSPKPVASCAMPAMPGMKIFTDTKVVKKAREGVMEFLLANHPLDCPICDQGGECDLQDQSEQYGQAYSRQRFPKRGVEDKDFGPLVKTTMTRCIHCTRCVRFSEEVAGFDMLGTTGRGNNMEIGTYVNVKYDSELSGNIVDLCPVGALTSKPYAFRARPWELNHTESIDVHDAVGSSIRIDHRGTNVMRILPRLNEDVNEEWLADKSRFSYDGLYLQRVDQPLLRQGDSFVPIDWREAMARVQQELSTVEPSQVKVIAGELADAESMVCMKDMMNSLGVENLATDGPSLPGDIRSDYLTNSSIAGLEDADYVLLVGTNPRMEAPLVASRLRKSVSLGLQKVASVGPDCNLAFEHKHLGNNTSVLKQIASGSHAFAKAFAKAERPAIIVGMGAVEEPGLLSFIQSLKETFPGLSNAESGWQGINVLHTAASRVGAQDLGFTSGNTASESPRFVYLLNADNKEGLAAQGVPAQGAFTVYQGHHGDVGAALADLVLPGLSYVEKSATFVNTEGRPQRTTRANIAQPGQAREDWTIIRAMAEVMGKPLSYSTVEDVRVRMADIAPHFASLNGLESTSFSPPLTSASSLGDSNLTPFLDNYYMTNAISRNSRIMAQCSAELPTARNSYV